VIINKIIYKMVEQSEDEVPTLTPPKIARVIVVAGFLGAGKTTLIESILKAPYLAKQVAVIQNEFSSKMGIESAQMKDGEGNDIEDFYEMPNGCICCAAKDDLIQTLDSLLEKTTRNIEYIIVETNGLADPCQVVQSFWLDDQLCSKVQLHSCIALVDSLTFTKKLQNSETKSMKDSSFVGDQSATNQVSEHPENELLMRQLVYADKVLVNKVDLLGEGKE
jgi:G3E family GTPase